MRISVVSCRRESRSHLGCWWARGKLVFIGFPRPTP